MDAFVPVYSDLRIDVNLGAFVLISTTENNISIWSYAALRSIMQRCRGFLVDLMASLTRKMASVVLSESKLIFRDQFFITTA